MTAMLADRSCPTAAPACPEPTPANAGGRKTPNRT